MKDRIEDRIEEKSKRAYHYHDLKGHYEEDNNTSLSDNTFAPFSNT